MNVNDIELHIKEVTQSDNAINPLLKACIQDELNTRYTIDGFQVRRNVEDIILSAISKAKILINNSVESITLNFKNVNVNKYVPLKNEIFNEWSLLDKIFTIVKAANDVDSNFFDRYSEYMTDSGERTVDYCGYTIPIDEECDFFIDFVDFGLHSYQLKKCI